MNVIKFLKKIAYLQIFFAIFCPIFAKSEDFSNSKQEIIEQIEENFNFDKMKNILFEYNTYGFSAEEYNKSMEVLFNAYEKELGKEIKKGKFGKVALKVYTNSGAGLNTPINLVEAVIKQLEKRGYERKNISIIDLDRRKLRECGFLPKYSQLQKGVADDFNGSPVYDLFSEKHYNINWFYDNQMPAKIANYLDNSSTFGLNSKNMRKSFLPVPLFLNVDFWINLPIITDMDSIAISASLANASIWNMSNSKRFLDANANAPIAVAEVLAIPEINESLLMNILTFEYAQVVGGTIFNQAYVSTDRMIIASKNPVIVDKIAFDFLNINRKRKGFKGFDDFPVLFKYCTQLDLGEWDSKKIKIKNL